MNAAKIQAKINRGAGIATRYLGTAYAWYRPSGAGNPILPANKLGTVMVDFKADFDFTGKKPNLYGHPIWGALFDWGKVAVGDYMVGDLGTFFIAAMQLHAPAAAVSCNRVLTLSRPGSGTPGSTF